MFTIWKFPLETKDIQEVEMPLGADILSAGRDGNKKICLWAKVNTEEKLRSMRKIRIAGTGHEIKITGQFIDTVTFIEGDIFLAFHIFEER